MAITCKGVDFGRSCVSHPLIYIQQGQAHTRMLSAVDSFTDRVDNTNAGMEDTYNYMNLGVVTDQTVSCIECRGSVGKMHFSRSGMLHRTGKGLLKSTSLTLYNMILLPTFDYCAYI